MTTQVQIDLVNLDQILESIMSGGSLSAYLKHSRIWEKVSRQQAFKFQVNNKA